LIFLDGLFEALLLRDLLGKLKYPIAVTDH
jgi:hypothetical protein